MLTLQQAGVVNAVAAGARPAWRKLWHIAGSKRRCWLPEKTTKCLWQEASTLRQRQQNSAFNCTQWQICSLPYVTNNKRLYALFCIVDWQTRSIARPLCDSRATCLLTFHGRIFSGFSGGVRNFFLPGHNRGILIITGHASLWEGDRDSPALFSNTGFHFQDLPHTQHVGCTDIVSFFAQWLI